MLYYKNMAKNVRSDDSIARSIRSISPDLLANHTPIDIQNNNTSIGAYIFIQPLGTWPRRSGTYTAKNVRKLHGAKLPHLTRAYHTQYHTHYTTHNVR